MPLYTVPATGSAGDPEGIRPDFGDLEVANWSGVYDPATHTYVIKTPDTEPVAELPEITANQDVGFDFSGLIVTPEQAESEQALIVELEQPDISGGDVSEDV